MRDTYCIFDNLMVTDIAGLEHMGDDEVLFGIVESCSELWVRGFGLNLDTDNWTVNCRCGARDDDGGRMVSCDICEIRQHTRCCGIEDSKAVPPLFVCEPCCTSLASPRAQSIALSLVRCDFLITVHINRHVGGIISCFNCAT
ncbi:hypothetical protein CQW23_11196 [Capsicum baccatum]|uniref:Zinc finger PHD-type domain-containing protein n=1 Tax=Capsicum baccatum TaxID=33114 RepID=A0A2G2X1Z5_CAPBA|nr:hypothetical protein CQW23_11196 [Capsicum baccatum]